MQAGWLALVFARRHTARMGKREKYWRAVKRLTVGLLLVWALVSFGAGIVLRPWLDSWSVGGAPLGFWMAQQGAIYVFVALIVIYCIAMDRLEAKYLRGKR